MNTYTGPPDVLRHDQGSAFTSAEFRGSLKDEGTQAHPAPKESPNIMGIGESIHGPLRNAFQKLWSDYSTTYSKEETLQAAVKCVNDAVGTHGLVPTFLVFG